MAQKIPCGGFNIDNETLQLKSDGITLYVAKDLQGNLTDEAVEEKFTDTELKGTTTAHDIISDGDVSAITLHGHEIIIDGNDLMALIQDIQHEIRELKEKQ